MAGRDATVLHLERNVARAPAFGPRAGIPLKSALAWPPVPLNRQPFLITHLERALGPGDLVVFANLCDRYWRDRAGGVTRSLPACGCSWRRSATAPPSPISVA